MENIEAVIKIAKNAGRAILEIYESGDFDVEIKSDNSPLTKADMAAHHIIVDALDALPEKLPILSEESKGISYETRKKWSKFWLVDPLDGTKEFIKRNGEFTVNIALIENGNPIAGVVHAPVPDITWYGSSTDGAYKLEGENRTKITCRRPAYDEVLKVVASRSHRGEEVDRFLAELGRKFEVLSCGSSMKLCMVAEGSAHIYPRLGPTMEWDTGAAHAVVMSAGGEVVETGGSPLLYNKENLLNPHFIVRAIV